MNKRVIFVCSQKGGAGKTTFAWGLLEALRYEGHTVAAYDAVRDRLGVKIAVTP